MFRGWGALNGQEMFNTSRLVAHMMPTVPTHDGVVASPMDCACEIRVPYDDSWTGLQAAVGDAPYVITNAPWYNAARPESAEFAGVWLMSVEGMDAVPVERDIAESICAGGVAGRARDTTRTITFSALVVACTNAGMRYGIDWLGCVLRQANARGGVDMAYYKSHPEDTAANPDTLKRSMYGLVYAQALTVSDLLGKGKENRHRQASICRVEWELIATRPYAFGQSTVLPVTWNATTTESIEWSHAPECGESESCGLPTLFNAECVPPNVSITAATIPTCGGCIPLCSLTRRSWEMPTVLGACDDTVVNIRVTNTHATDPLTVNFYWQPCGSTDICDRVFPLQVAGLQPGHIAVADSVTGRPYVEVDGIRRRQVGIISTPNGAPWQSTSLDTILCWELVAESAPDASFDVIVELRERDA